jgi:DNA-binding MarR family transcriptional regulator
VAAPLPRGADPHDRRLVRVFLTDRGRQLRQVLNQQMANVSEQALSGRSKKDWATLIGFLRQVRDNLM